MPRAGAALVAETLLRAAQSETGLCDFGDDSFVSRFEDAVAEVNAAGMDHAGQREAARVCHWLLTSRLEFFADFKRHPIGDEMITRPLFATGEPRSGTTLLHALLSVDPNARALRFWEVMYPSPPPGVAPAGDPRRARADEDWREINRRMPKWLVCHPYNDMLGDGLPEDERCWAFDLRQLSPTAWWRVPMAPLVGLQPDAPAQYRLHKMMLQQLQYRRPEKYWVLKGFHGQRLDALFDTYPDASVIWIHRDPVQAIASAIALLATLVEELSGTVDMSALAAAQLDASRTKFAATLQHALIDDPRIHHVRYPDFVADPVGTVRSFYERYGVPWTGAAETAMRDYLRGNQSNRYGKFHYSTDLLGADVDALHAEFAPYRERFGLEIEHRR